MTDPHQTEVFERVVRPHFDRLYRLAWRLTGAKHEAEDLFQELLIKAFGMLDELVHIEEPGSWLCRVMYNQFVDQHRRFARQRMHLVDEGHLPGQGREAGEIPAAGCGTAATQRGTPPRRAAA
jgi:RNA polymerase sigma-70 factor (ECF subfamily)